MPTGFKMSSRLEITSSGQKHDAFKLASDCVNEWNNYLNKNGIVLDKK
jgi:hypothetical protein